MADAAGSFLPGSIPEKEVSAPIDIKLKDQNENEVFFKIKKTTKLSKVFNAYCERQSIQRASVRFLLDGSRVQDDDTPAGLEMEDGDMLEVVLEQLGGDAAPDPTSHVKISIRDCGEIDVFFMMRQNMNMLQTFNKFCEMRSMRRDNVQLFFSGRPVRNDDTPRALELLDGDMIVAIRAPPVSLSAMKSPSEIPKRIMIGVVDHTGQSVYFSIKDSRRLGRLMNAYNLHRSAGFGSTRFIFEGQRILECDTAKDVGMQDGDVMEVWTELRVQTEAADAQQCHNDERKVKILLALHAIDQDFDQYSDQIQFRIKTTTLLKKVMNAFCQRLGLNRNTLRFLFDGARIQDTDTPKSLGIVEDDCIEVVVQQSGGSNGDQVTETVEVDNMIPESEPKIIQIKVKNTQGDEVTFRFKSTAKLEKLMKSYAVRQGRDIDSLRYFRRDGRRVEKTDTAEELEIKNGEVIDVYEEQQGGFFAD